MAQLDLSGKPDGIGVPKQMKQQRKSGQQILYAFLFLAAMLVLFYFYTTQNKARIQEQNRIYAEDCARQMAERIESEFDNALQRIENSAYLISAGVDKVEINTDVLKEMEENTTFDAIRFTNAEGMNLASDGGTNNSLDRDYFIKGMRGERGIETVEQSRLTGKPMMVFYAPIYSGKDIDGMFLGLYFAEDYLRDILSVNYFGETADVYLCSQEGQVIASSEEKDYGDDLLDSFIETGVIDDGTAKAARTVFTDGGEVALLCSEGCKIDNLSVIDLPDYDFVLVQAFPKDVTQSMVTRANMAGVMLEICLVVMFLIYIAFLIVRAKRQRKALETENRMISDVLRGMNMIFSSRYLMINLETNYYSYIAGSGPLNPSGRRIQRGDRGPC
jgi:cbb3-type cytochrome oxidase subunit 3